MNIVDWTQELASVWDALCDRSPDSWLWHHSEWLRYSVAIIESDCVKNLSFLVMEGSRPIALQPCFAETSKGQNLALKYGRDPLPWPVIDPTLTPNERQTVEEFIFDTLHKKAKELSLREVAMTSHVLSESFYKAPFSPAPLPNRYGYQTTATDTWVLDLTRSPEELWNQVRKGHKSSIKTGQKTLTLHTWRGAITTQEFHEYQKLHALAAGRVTRCQATFDIMREMVKTGHAMLIGAKQEQAWIGFIYLMAYKRSAYYASACRHPDVAPSLSVGHALLWEGVQSLKKEGFEIFEIGPQTYPSLAPNPDQTKLVNISMFKRGFGGFGMPRYLSRAILPEMPGV